jgi:hypothetical protein
MRGYLIFITYFYGYKKFFYAKIKARLDKSEPLFY